MLVWLPVLSFKDAALTCEGIAPFGTPQDKGSCGIHLHAACTCASRPMPQHDKASWHRAQLSTTEHLETQRFEICPNSCSKEMAKGETGKHSIRSILEAQWQQNNFTCTSGITMSRVICNTRFSCITSVATV